MRICKNCGHTIRRCERWRVIHRVFWLFRLSDQYAHHNCLHPQEGPAPKTKRLPGEVPLPFPEPVDAVKHSAGVGFPVQQQTALPPEVDRIDVYARGPEEEDYILVASQPIPAEDRIALSRAKADELIRELA